MSFIRRKGFRLRAYWTWTELLTRRWRQQVPPKRWSSFIKLLYVISQETDIWICWSLAVTYFLFNQVLPAKQAARVPEGKKFIRKDLQVVAICSDVKYLNELRDKTNVEKAPRRDMNPLSSEYGVAVFQTEYFTLTASSHGGTCFCLGTISYLRGAQPSISTHNVNIYTLFYHTVYWLVSGLDDWKVGCLIPVRGREFSPHYL
jgi:hypothetical protein